MQTHEIFQCRDGSWTLKSLRFGQAMHSEIGPEREAREIFLGPSALAERLTRPGEPLVLYDLGLGIAMNALIVLECWESLPHPKRRLCVVSFENDISGLKLAIPLLPPGRAERCRELLERGFWRRGALSWELWKGPFEAAVLAPEEAEVVFHDFYSPKTCPALWDEAIFRKLRAAMRSDGILLTYSAASSVRRALRAAGFQVSAGPGTELKRESTHARVSRQSQAAALQFPS